MAAVGAKDRSFAAKNGANGSRNNAIPIEIAAAVEVAAACGADRHVIRMVIGQCQDVSAGLAGVVGMSALQGSFFGIGQNRLIAIGFVGRGDDDLRPIATAAG